MTQKERLVDLCVSYYQQLYVNYYQQSWLIDEYLKLLAEKFVDDLLSNGVIVPPCKVGDEVYIMWYRPSSKEHFVQSSIVTGITFMKCEWYVETDDDPRLFGSLFKKEWFTDHEEAEQALKECETS